MWRALLIAVVAAVGCGDVTMQTKLDADGCPVDAAGWTGIGDLSTGCATAPATTQISGGSYESIYRPYVQVHSYNPGGLCQAYVIVQTDCGDAGYSLDLLPGGGQPQR